MLEFTIQSMTCGHCVKAVTEAIKSADPKAQVDIDLPSHRVRVESTAARQQLAASLSEAGYAPS